MDRPDRPLNPEQIQRRFDVLRELHPELGDRMQNIRRAHPDRFKQILIDRWPQIQRYSDLRQNDPEGFGLEIQDRRLERESHELGHKLRSGKLRSDTKNAQIAHENLREKVRQHFKVRQDKYERELAKLEKQVEALRKKIASRIANKGKIIEERYGELVGKSNRSDW